MTPASSAPLADGVHAMVPRDKMDPSARLLRDTYNVTPGARLFRREFGYYCIHIWQQQGLPADADFAQRFHYDPPGNFGLGNLGWCEAQFCPGFEYKVVEDRGDHEVVQDWAGRLVLYFKNRRNGFMPEYIGHPVGDQATWEANCKWRLQPDTPGRFDYLKQLQPAAVEAAGKGKIITQGLVGGYMYLRSLIGPEGIMYAFYDMPDVVHDCMKTWLALADAVIARHQEFVTIDEIYFAEDICYNHGPLCSPDTMREFLFPYYQQLITNLKRRQIDKTRRLLVQIDTDGLADPVIDLYRDLIGMTAMSPFEAAAGCDVLRTAEKYPDMALFGGIDKRVLAKGPKAIDEMVDRILPAMRKRGGYIPTCDHGVPEEVSLANYEHYRKRCLELGG